MDRARLEQRFAAVETLIERSSAARQIEASGVAGGRGVGGGEWRGGGRPAAGAGTGSGLEKIVSPKKKSSSAKSLPVKTVFAFFTSINALDTALKAEETSRCGNYTRNVIGVIA